MGSPPPLFRFGFVCLPAGGRSVVDRSWTDVVRSWRQLEFGDLVIHHDPQAPVHMVEAGGDSAVLIGEAFTVRATRLESALESLLAVETDDRLFAVIDELGGRFALIVRTGSAYRAFHDPLGTRSLFYRAEGELCIGSHPELVAAAFGDRDDPAAREVVASAEYKSRSVKYLPGDMTMFEGVRALAPNNLYDLVERRTVRYWPRRQRRRSAFNDFAGALDRHLGALAGHLRDRRSPIVGVTGGIDTRVLIAAFRRFELPFRGMTWRRKRGGVDDEELEVIEAVAGEAGIEHAYLDLSEIDDEMRAVARLARRNVGGWGQPSRITAHVHRRFGDARDVFVRGYGAEVIRGFYNLEGASSLVRRIAGRTQRRAAIAAPTPQALLRAYDSSMRAPKASAEHTRSGLAAFEGFIERANFDQALVGFGFDLSDLFYWEHRMGMWGSAKHNEMDPAVLSVAGFNSREVFEAGFGLEPDERLTKELLLRVIGRYDERLAVIPYI